MRAILAAVYVVLTLSVALIIVTSLRPFTQPADATQAAAGRVSLLLTHEGYYNVVLPEGVYLRCHNHTLYVVDGYGHETRVDTGGRLVEGEDVAGDVWLAVNSTHVVCIVGYP